MGDLNMLVISISGYSSFISVVQQEICLGFLHESRMITVVEQDNKS